MTYLDFSFKLVNLNMKGFNFFFLHEVNAKILKQRQKR